MADKSTVMFEDAEIIFKNFAGREGQYNVAGNRNFAVIIPDEKTAQDLIKIGWNVKYLKAREEGDEETPYLPVAVSYSNRPPNVVMITSRARTKLTEDTIESLDYADIAKIDLVVNPFDWTANGKSGTKAYLKTMFVTINEDELERKYAADEPDNFNE